MTNTVTVPGIGSRVKVEVKIPTEIVDCPIPIVGEVYTHIKEAFKTNEITLYATVEGSDDTKGVGGEHLATGVTVEVSAFETEEGVFPYLKDYDEEKSAGDVLLHFYGKILPVVVNVSDENIQRSLPAVNFTEITEEDYRNALANVSNVKAEDILYRNFVFEGEDTEQNYVRALKEGKVLCTKLAMVNYSNMVGWANVFALDDTLQEKVRSGEIVAYVTYDDEVTKEVKKTLKEVAEDSLPSFFVFEVELRNEEGKVLKNPLRDDGKLYFAYPEDASAVMFKETAILERKPSNTGEIEVEPESEAAFFRMLHGVVKKVVEDEYDKNAGQ